MQIRDKERCLLWKRGAETQTTSAYPCDIRSVTPRGRGFEPHNSRKVPAIALRNHIRAVLREFQPHSQLQALSKARRLGLVA